MKKVLYLFGVFMLIVLLVSGIQKIDVQKVFAEIANTVSGDKEEQFVSVENSPLSIVGLVTEILGDTSIKVYARDNKIYTIDLSNSEIVFGDLGYYGEPSSFDKIKITDQVTVVFDNEPYDSKIIAKEIAHRRTPEAIIKRQKDLAELFNVEFATSTRELPGEIITEELVENESSTNSTTTIAEENLADNSNSTTSSELNSDKNNSIIDTVADVAKDVIQGTADTLINVIDAVTGEDSETQDNTTNQNTAEQSSQENSVETQAEIKSSNTEANDSVDGDKEEYDNIESSATENNTDEGNVSEQTATE